MSYIGQQLPADVFSGFTIDKFTGDGTANKALTLSEAPFNETAVLVTIDGVVQEPTDDFTVSGTTLTLVGTAANGSEINVTHLSGPVPVTQAASLDLNGASDKLILDADGDTTISADTDDQIDIKIAGADDFRFSANAMNVLSGSTLTVDSGATITNSGTATGFTDNTPAFHAFLNSSQNVGHTAQTTIVFNSEVFDSDSAYDTSNGKFTVPSGEAGKYYVYASLMRNNFTNSRYIVYIAVGGTTKIKAEERNSDTGGTTFDTVGVGGILDLSAGDEVTVSLYQDSGDSAGANGNSSESLSFFMGFKLGV